jgi:hypothetical protein
VICIVCRPDVPTTPSFHMHFHTIANQLNAVWAPFYMFQQLRRLLWEQAFPDYVLVSSLAVVRMLTHPAEAPFDESETVQVTPFQVHCELMAVDHTLQHHLFCAW